jgi:sterol desaturase/sphingolipid hydroxylase (fatty acid hydroxylase superfamily)
VLPFLLHQLDKLHQAAALLLAPAGIFTLPEAGFAFLLAVGFLIWRHWRRRRRFRPAVLWRTLVGSRYVVFSRSTRADVFYYFINTFAISGLIGWGLVSAETVSAVLLRLLHAAFGAHAPVGAPDWMLRAGLTMALFLGYEIGYYIDHYAKHKIPLLWAFHQTHHSAEVLTPLTVFRVHPLDTLIFVNVVALTTGIAHGLFIYLAARPAEIYAVGGANIFAFAGYYLVSQLQHSQFWMPLRGLPGRLILSPSHHQLHHSTDAAHYNCNLGSVLAVWDWMFGTLVVPPLQSPRLRFGVAQNATDPHRLSTLLVDPVVNALAILQKMVFRAWPRIFVRAGRNLVSDRSHVLDTEPDLS